VALFVAAIMIFSSIPTIATPGNTTKMNKIGVDSVEEIHSIALAPKNEEAPLLSADLSSGTFQMPLRQDGYLMYMEHTVSGGGAEHFSIDTENPNDIYEEIRDSEAGDFLSAGTFGCDEIWYGVQFSDGVLWGMEIYSDAMWSIGGGGDGLNSLAWDPIYNRMFGTHVPSGYTDTLMEIDPDTGEQDEMFDLDYSGGLMIGMAFDEDGILYGWELVQDKLWTIDYNSEEVEEVGPLGININYAQDGDFHRESDQLFLTAYSGGGKLVLVDEDTGDGEVIGNLPNSWECAASCFENICTPPEHDVGVKAIVAPTESGHAVPSMDMELLVKNYGNNTETFNAQMEIIKCEDSGIFLMNEDFSGGVMPEGWDTDFWTIVNSNYASGTAPEARVYKYDQYYGGQYYDNYIQSAEFDATGWEKLTMDFRWAANMVYPQYCSFFVKWRKNETSSWKDVTPWDNPIGENKDGDFYEIDCYGFGEELGKNFSILWQYKGYYYYYNYFYLDDINVEGCGGCAEYAELQTGITLNKGEEANIEFPGWTPSEWHNESFQDAWEDYPVHGFTIMEGDQRPRNDHKWQLLELYYPWFYDIEVSEIGEPQEARSMPARTFDVEATIKNVGQFDMCCIPCDINIGAPVVLDTLFEEYDWPTTGWPYYYRYGPGYGSGWRDEHKKIAYYYGWYWSTTNYAGGESPEPYLPYYRARADHVYSSAVIDTTEYQSLQLSFLSYINHYSGQGLYALEVGYTHDGENWYAAWHEEPSGTGSYEVQVPVEGGSENFQIGFWVKGNPWYFNYWYIDNVKLEAVGLDVEFTDFACQGDDLPPGEERTFYFDPWTPEHMETEETAWEVPYKAECSIEVEGDMDPGNDIVVNDFKLDYWHDPALLEVTGPAIGDRQEMLWQNGEPDGRNGLAGSEYYGYENLLIDDFILESQGTATGGDFSFVWNSGSGTGNLDDVEVYFFENLEDECDPSEDDMEGSPLTVTSFEEETTGEYYFGRPEIVVTVEFDDFALDAGERYWVGFQPDSVGEDLGYLLTAEDKECECYWEGGYWGYSRWRSSSQQWGTSYDIAWALTGYSKGPPGIDVYIQPGTESIDAVAINQGTFNELDLVCNAQIWEYITDPDNGTQQYEDNVSNIDLDEPLGGTFDLAFNDFTFAYEGRYGLYLEMPDSNGDDDFPKNNNIRYGVGVDSTDPVSTHALDPAEPDGEAGYYVSDLEVTLTAYDPLSGDVSSGVNEIKYQIDDGPIETIAGSSGSFLVTQEHDNNDIEITYWAIDLVGNDEDANLITPLIDMDQTPPSVDLTYECVGGNEMQGYEMVFTATATDAVSEMNRVEFFLNDGLQAVIPGPGPTYEWGFTWFDDISIIITVDAYDNAGNMASDFVEDPDSFSNEFNQAMQQAVKLFQE
jgi:hypothetical protein